MNSAKSNDNPVKLAIIASHFIQYQAPLWRALAKRPELNVRVYYLSDHGRRPGLDRQFGEVFQWDIPLDTGYNWELLPGAMGVSPGSHAWKWNFEPARLVFNNVSDVYFRSDYASPGAIAFFYAGLVKKVPILYRGETTLKHENKSKSFLKRFLLSPVFKRQVWGLAIGKLAFEYITTLGVPRPRIFLSPYNVNTDYWEKAAQKFLPKRARLRQQLGLPVDAPVVLFCGKLIPKKRPLDLAKAMCVLSEQRELSLVVVGTGEQLDEMKKLAGRCPRLHTYFAGFVNQTQLPEFYAMADILSLPSGGTETWGLVVNEAMYFGIIPVVSDMVGCAPDLVEGVGEIHPVGDIQTLAESIALVLDDLPQRRKLISSRIALYSQDRAVQGIVDAALEAGKDNAV